MNSFFKKIFRRFGYDLISAKRSDELYFAGIIPYMTHEQKKIIDTCRPFTQTSTERMFALIRSVEHLVRNGISGAFVECGVWRGGSVMAMAMTVEGLKTSRDLYLFDTFTGMPSGTQVDVDLDGNNEAWYRSYSDQHMQYGKETNWNAASLDEVRTNIASLELSKQKFHYIQSKAVKGTAPFGTPAHCLVLPACHS